MKRKQFPVEQIVGGTKASRGGSAGSRTDPASRDHGAGAVSVEEAIQGTGKRSGRQFKQLREENGRLKRLVAELTLDKVML